MSAQNNIYQSIMSVFTSNLRKNTKENDSFYRKVLSTFKGKLQLVIYKLEPQQSIEKEIHTTQVQFIYAESGTGMIVIYKNKKDDEGVPLELSEGVCVIIPPKTYHYIHNDGENSLKMFSIYCPPHFAPYRYDLTPE